MKTPVRKQMCAGRWKAALVSATLLGTTAICTADPKADAEEAKRQALEHRSKEWKLTVPVANAQKDAADELERIGVRPEFRTDVVGPAPLNQSDIERAFYEDAAQKDARGLEGDVQPTGSMRGEPQVWPTPSWSDVARGSARDNLQMSIAGVRNPQVEASERITEAPAMDSLPPALGEKLRYNPETDSVLLRGALQEQERALLLGLPHTLEDRLAYERLIQPRYEYGKPLFLYLRLFNLQRQERKVEALPACGSLGRADGLRFRIIADYGDSVLLQNPYTDEATEHGHPPLVVPGDGHLEGVYDLNGWIHRSGKLRQILGRAKEVKVTAEIPSLNLSTASVKILVKHK